MRQLNNHHQTGIYDSWLDKIDCLKERVYQIKWRVLKAANLEYDSVALEWCTHILHIHEYEIWKAWYDYDIERVTIEHNKKYISSNLIFSLTIKGIGYETILDYVSLSNA